jgi:hypothetical protein
MIQLKQIIAIKAFAVLMALLAQTSIFAQSRPSGYAAPQVKRLHLVRSSELTMLTPAATRLFSTDAPISSDIKNLPEEGLHRLITSMVNGDYQMWLGLHDVSTQKRIAERNLEQKRTEQDWIQIWRNFYSLKQYEIISRSEYFRRGEFYVMFLYRLSSSSAASTDNSAKRDFLVFKKSGERWVSTHDLSDDPIVGLAPFPRTVRGS